MCGICGFSNTSDQKPFSKDMLQAMCRTIAHRGPDDEGLHTEPHLALGARRLSILDLGGGHQPLSNEDGTIWAAHNGEIYNLPDLRKELEASGHQFRTGTDTEVIVHAYEEWGEDFPTRLRGMFASAVWAPKTNATAVPPWNTAVAMMICSRLDQRRGTRQLAAWMSSPASMS